MGIPGGSDIEPKDHVRCSRIEKREIFANKSSLEDFFKEYTNIIALDIRTFELTADEVNSLHKDGHISKIVSTYFPVVGLVVKGDLPENPPVIGTYTMTRYANAEEIDDSEIEEV